MIDQMLLAMMGGKRPSTTDTDAAAWAAAVTVAGGTYSAGTLAAVSAFCTAAKAHSYWTKLNRINLFAGDQLAAALVPLKIGGGNTTDTNVNFVSGDYTEATGLKGNASSKYLRTGLIPSASLSLSDTHFMAYNRGSTAASDMVIGFDTLWQFFYPLSNGSAISDTYTTAGRITVVPSAPYGMGLDSKNGSGSHVVYRNGVSIGSDAVDAGTLPTREVYVFSRNSSGSPSYFGGATVGAYSIGSGLSATDAANFYTDLQAFQTALGRQV